MPISQFPEGLQKVISFLPGTYGTSLLRNHAMRGSLDKMAAYVPEEIMVAMRDTVDCNVYLLDNKVEIWQMYLYLGICTAVILGIYVLINFTVKKKGVTK